MSVLNNFDIEDICVKLKIPLAGVYAKNELKHLRPKIGQYYVVNMQDSDDGDGSHWVSCGFTKYGNFYFDSYGADCPDVIQKFLRKIKLPVFLNYKQIQNYSSENCG